MVMPIWLENLIFAYLLIQFFITFLTAVVVWVLMPIGDTNLLRYLFKVGKSLVWPIVVAAAVYRYFTKGRFNKEWRELVADQESVGEDKTETAKPPNHETGAWMN